jgi:hypothetical protein
MMRNIMIAVAVLALAQMAGTPMADARGGLGHRHGDLGHHRSSARAMGAGHAGRRESGSRDMSGDGSHANGAHLKAVSEAEDRLLKQKLKSICRGC